MSLDTLLATYLAARAQHLEAGRLMLRAERTAEKLTKRHGDWPRACKVAGVDLADERVIAAYRDTALAREALMAALRGAPFATRLRIIGRLLCADLPKPANANDRR